MINAAIVGLGRWGRTLVAAAHGCAGKVRITHAVVTDQRKHADYADEHQLELGTRFDDVVALRDLDAVILATPHSLHVPQVLAAARAGKHVFCEKPLALTHADALIAVRACEAAGRVLAVGHDKRWWPSMVALRELAANGTLGDILHVEGHTSNQHSSAFAGWRERPEEAPGGGMTGAGIHVLDALLSIAGPAAEITAKFTLFRGGHDPRDTVSALCRFKSGVSGTFSTVRVTPFYWRVHVFGERANAEALSETELIVRAGGAVEKRQFEPANAVTRELAAFAEAVEAGTPYPMSTDEVLATVGALEATIRSIACGDTVKLH